MHISLLLLLLLLPFRASALTMDWVPVRDPGNPADDTGVGSVAYGYSISRYEVTNAQYAEFLNAVVEDGIDVLDLYHIEMGNDFSNGGIRIEAANPDGSKYVVKAGFENKPVTYVSFFDALRFANWLHNGQGDGSTETGAYTLLGGTPTPSNWRTVSRNELATTFLPSEDEWYKAAYYDPIAGLYHEYPAGADAAMSCAPPTSAPNSGNTCSGAVGAVTDVGSYTGSPSPYGTFDQGGNVFEWNEAVVATSYRQLRGGSWLFTLSASFYSSQDPRFFESEHGGFRVASLVPEPGTGILVGLGLLVLATRREGRRRDPRS